MRNSAERYIASKVGTKLGREFLRHTFRRHSKVREAVLRSQQFKKEAENEQLYDLGWAKIPIGLGKAAFETGPHLVGLPWTPGDAIVLVEAIKGVDLPSFRRLDPLDRGVSLAFAVWPGLPSVPARAGFRYVRSIVEETARDIQEELDARGTTNQAQSMTTVRRFQTMVPPRSYQAEVKIIDDVETSSKKIKAATFKHGFENETIQEKQYDSAVMAGADVGSRRFRNKLGLYLSGGASLAGSVLGSYDTLMRLAEHQSAFYNENTGIALVAGSIVAGGIGFIRSLDGYRRMSLLQRKLDQKFPLD